MRMALTMAVSAELSFRSRPGVNCGNRDNEKAKIALRLSIARGCSRRSRENAVRYCFWPE